jgi:hypothetical protein
MSKNNQIPFQIKHQIQLDKIANDCLLHIKDTTTVVTHLYSAIQDFPISKVCPLPTDNLQNLFNSDDEVLVKENQMVISLEWIMKKAFEDFINAIFKSLKEAFKTIKFLEFCLKGEFKESLNRVLTQLDDIEKKADRKHFHNLIEEIEKTIKQELIFKNEIISINKARNCIVHRDSIVKNIDTNNDQKDKLIVQWIALNSYIRVEDSFEKLTFKRREKNVLLKAHEFREESEYSEFKIGESIKFTINDFNGITYSCYKFANQLFKSCINYQNEVKPQINFINSDLARED